MTASLNAEKGSIHFTVPQPTGGEWLVSTNPTSGLGFCSGPATWGQPDEYRILRFEFDLDHKGKTRSFNVTTKPQGVNRERAVVRRSVPSSARA